MYGELPDVTPISLVVGAEHGIKCSTGVPAVPPFDSSVRKIVYMIPKEPGVDHITKQRPLKLQESLDLRRSRSGCGAKRGVTRKTDLP